MNKRIAIMGEGGADTGAAAPPVAIADAASAGFSPELIHVPGAEFPGSPEARDRVAIAYLQEGIRLAQAGYDALYINTVGDYGRDELRESITIPVVGSGEAAVRLAQMQHGDFSIITIWPPSLQFIYDKLLDDTNTRQHCRSIKFISEDEDLATLAEPENFVTEMRACRLTSMEKIRAATTEALEEDRASRIILGCTCMQPVADILKQEKLPIIEPMTAGYQLAELLLTA